MTVEPSWLSLVAGAVGPVGEREPLGSSTWRLTVDGRVLVAKTGPGASDEATGLRTLAAAVGAPPVPEVVLAQADLLVTEWVPQAPHSRAHSEALGRSLARLHSTPWPAWGGGSSWIGGCHVNAPRTERSRLLRAANAGPGPPMRFDGGGGTGREPLGRPVPLGRPGAGDGDLCGAMCFGIRWAGVADRSVGPRGPPRGGSGHAPFVRPAAGWPPRCLRGGRTRSGKVGRRQGPCFPFIPCSYTRSCSEGATGTRPSRRPGGTGDQDRSSTRAPSQSSLNRASSSAGSSMPRPGPRSVRWERT